MGRSAFLRLHVDKKKIRLLGVTTLHDTRRYAIPTQFRNAWAPHTQTQRHGELALMIRPYKPRDSARSALLDCSYFSPPFPCLTVVGRERGAGTSSTQIVVRARD